VQFRHLGLFSLSSDAANSATRSAGRIMGACPLNQIYADGISGTQLVPRKSRILLEEHASGYAI